MEMTNGKNNQGEDEIWQSRIWEGSVMKGTWDGNGIWQEDGKWTGNGTWQGGLLSGTWNVKGDWKAIGNGIGECKGVGRIESNVPFAINTVKSATVIGLAAVVVIGLILNGLVFGAFGVIVAIALLFIVVIIALQQTNKGKLWVEGTWKDGEFRILDMVGEWRLGIHKGIIKGKMKDPKPSKGETKDLKSN